MEQPGCCNKPWVSNQILMPYTKAFWLGEDGLLGVFGFFPPDFFSHGQAPHMDLPLQWAPAWGGNRNPMKAAWGLLSIHPAPLPCGAMPGGAGPLPAPGKAPVCECGGTQGTCRKLCGIAEDGKIPGICPFSEKTSELGGVFLSIQSARLLGNFLRRLWL